MISAKHLNDRRVSPRFRTAALVRAGFHQWNKAWKGTWRMRLVQIEDGGYAAVVRPKGGAR